MFDEEHVADLVLECQADIARKDCSISPRFTIPTVTKCLRFC